MNYGQLDWGKTNRMAQVFRPNAQGEAHTVMLAVDHPYFYGPTTGLEDPRETILPLVPYADAISPAKGTLVYSLDPLVPTPVILRVTGGNSMTRREELSNEHIITSVAEAAKLNAVGVSISVYIDTEHQAQNIRNLGTLANEASKYGLLVLGITAVGAKLEPMVKAAAAKAAEEGAEATKAMRASKGRAARLGDRSLGHIDPGAASTALIVGVMATQLTGR